MASRSLEAAIFDMDGLLTASEARWRIAERHVCDAMGLPLTDADFDLTAGVRMVDVAKQWYEWHPWPLGPSTDEVAASVVDRVIELTAGAVCLPGVERTLDLVASEGLKIALCSSSDTRLIKVTLDALGLTDRFRVIHSAEADAYGKPHPEPYLVTAAKLEVDPLRCVVFEDAVNGCLAAKAARMAAIAVPDPADYGSIEYGFVDVVLSSLAEFGPEHLDLIRHGRTQRYVSLGTQASASD